MSDLWVSTLQGQAFPWKRKNLITGKEEVAFVQGALRPIQLWTYVFPEECLGEVLQMLQLNDEHIKASDNLGTKMLRKALNIEPVPLGIDRNIKHMININGQPINSFHMVSGEGMDIRPIGIKRDKRGPITFPDGSSYDQEQL